jgi:hypothetical protein
VSSNLNQIRLRVAAQHALEAIELLVKDPEAEDLMTKLNRALILLRSSLRDQRG